MLPTTTATIGLTSQRNIRLDKENLTGFLLQLGTKAREIQYVLIY